MNSVNFANAYKEVYEILKYINEEDLKQIPKEFMEMIKNKMNKDYIYKYDPEIEFKNQKMLRETKCIFAYIFMNYWGTKKQKLAIKKLFIQDIINNN